MLDTPNIIKIIHISFVCLGLGCATALYIYAVKFFVLENIIPDSYRIFYFMSMIVNVSLLILWITGFSSIL